MLWTGITREGDGSSGVITLAATDVVTTVEVIPHRFPDFRARSSDYGLHLRGYIAVE